MEGFPERKGLSPKARYGCLRQACWQGTLRDPRGLRDERGLFGVWFKELRWVQDILHVRVAYWEGQAVVSPACHRRCSTCGRRERTSWHLDIWQYETIVHGAVLKAKCPADSVHAARML